MLSAAVNVVTTDGPAGRHGFTASAVCSVTDNPPTLLVCMNTLYLTLVWKFCAKQGIGGECAGWPSCRDYPGFFASKLEAQARFEHGTWHTLWPNHRFWTMPWWALIAKSGKSRSRHTRDFICRIKPYNKAKTRQAWCILTVNTMPSIKLKSKRPANHNAKAPSQILYNPSDLMLK